MKSLPPRRQRGIALLLAVLLSALAALLAFAILDSQAVALQRTHAQMRGAQLDEFARGVEAIAAIALRRDEANLDHNGDVWRQPLILEIPRGRLVARMRDLNGCFNVNALADPTLVAETHARLTRLLQALELDPQAADAIADYIDADQAQRDQGAEDLRYLGGRPAYRSADRPIAHVSELRAVAGVDAETYRRLAGEICALAPLAPINVNTASVALLRSLAVRIDRAQAAALAEEGNARHVGLDEFLQKVDSTGASRPTSQQGLGVVSDEFLLESEIEYDGMTVAYWAHLTRRPGQPVLVEARGRGRYR